MNQNQLEIARDKEKKARSHGRHTMLEQKLNALGLSLFAPPFDDFRTVQGNQWEGHSIPGELRTQLQELIDAVVAELYRIQISSGDSESIKAHCYAATQRMTELANYIYDHKE